MSSSVTYNTNVGGGSMTVVSGPQHNTSYGLQNITNVQGAILVLPAQSTSSKPIERAEPELVSRFSSVVDHISSYCSSLQDIQNEYPRITLLTQVSNEMRGFASIVTFIGAAFSIVAATPGRLDRLSYFRSTQALLLGCARSLSKLNNGVKEYKQLITPPSEGSLRQDILLCILAHHFARLTFRRLMKFLRSRMDPLNRFVDSLTSENGILPEPSIRELKSLLGRTGVHPVPRLYHLPLSSFSVRNHLGDYFRIPLGFCLSDADFRIIVKDRCRNVPGSDFIKHDDWVVVKPGDNTILDDESELFKVINAADAVLDISLILDVLEAHLFTCPNCSSDNSGRNTDHGWIVCYHCDKDFCVDGAHLDQVRTEAEAIMQNFDGSGSGRTKRFFKNGIDTFRKRWPKGRTRITRKQALNWITLFLQTQRFDAPPQLDIQSKAGALPNVDDHPQFRDISTVADHHYLRVIVRAQKITQRAIKVHVDMEDPGSSQILTSETREIGRSQDAQSDTTQVSKVVEVQGPQDPVGKFVQASPATADSHSPANISRKSKSRSGWIERVTGGLDRLPLLDDTSKSRPFVVLLLGRGGSGRSTFINTAIAKPRMKVSYHQTLQAVTKDIAYVFYSDPLHKRKFVFVDTPGLDCDKSLYMIERVSKKFKQVDVAIHLISIADTRATIADNFILSNLLRGDGWQKKVILATTMKSSVDPDVAEKIEVKLRSSRYKVLLDQGFQWGDFDKTHKSAWRLINQVIPQ